MIGAAVLDGRRPRGVATARRTAWALVLPTLAVAAVVAARGAHWCYLPIWACGVVAVAEAAREIARTRSVLRTGAAVWTFLVFFVFVAPLLHIYQEFWMRYVVLPADMRPWLGALAAWTFAGLLAMAVAQRFGERPRAGRRSARWEILRRRFVILGAASLAAALGAEAALWLRFGGLEGLYSAFERGPDSFRGVGPLVVVASTLPSVAAALTLGLVPRRRLIGWGLPLLVVFVIIQLAVSGPYGSRASLIVPVLWAFVVWDRMVAALRWKQILLLAAVVSSLLVGYGIYKSFGSFATALPPPWSVKVRPPADPLASFILLDLGRYDVQALLLERFAGPDRWRLGAGRTYVGGLVSLVPTRLYPGKPETKVQEGSDALYGAGFFAHHPFAVTNQFGLAGEAVLNFGPPAIPLAYGVFGFLIGLACRKERSLGRRDPRWLLVAFLPPLAVRALMTDSDNMALLALQSFLFLAPIVCLGTRRVPARAAP